jgi:hypothetical protein
MTDKELMQQALDTLQGLFGSHSDSGGVAVWRLGGSSAVKDAITALRSRLEQPEDEPVSLKERIDEAVKAERERIFGVLLDMHDKTQGTHNYYIHAVQHIRARGNT